MPISKPGHYVESIEILTEPERRRRRTAQEKIAIVQETLEPGASVSAVARRHGVMIEREQLALPGAPNEVWSIDFVMDALSNGRRVKCLTVVDDFTKEAVDIVVDHGISGLYVAREHWTVQLASVAIPRRCEQTRDPNLRAARLTSGHMRTASL